MPFSYTKHAHKRVKARNIESSKVKRTTFATGAKYLGSGRYLGKKKFQGKTVSVVYSKSSRGKTIITSWKS